MNHLKNFLDGYGSLLGALATRRQYIRADEVPRNGFAKDAANLRGDFCTVAGDLRKATDKVYKEHEQQIYAHTRKK